MRKMGARGAFQMQQNTKLKKIGVVLNSPAPFLPIWEDMGAKMEANIYQKSLKIV